MMKHLDLLFSAEDLLIWIPIKPMAVNLEEPIAARTRSKSNT